MDKQLIFFIVCGTKQIENKCTFSYKQPCETAFPMAKTDKSSSRHDKNGQKLFDLLEMRIKS